MIDRRIVGALAVSLLLHLALLAGPGWIVPGTAQVKSKPLLAELRPPPKLAPQAAAEPAPPPAPQPKPRPKPKPKAAPKPTPELPSVAMPPSPEQVAPPPVEAAPEPELAEAPGKQVPEIPAEPDSAPAPEAPQRAEGQDTGAVAGAPVSTQPPAPADLFPHHGRIYYEAARGAAGFVVGTAEATWLTQGENYQFRLYLQTAGVVALLKRITISYASDGQITGNGFVPRTYRMDQDGQLKESATFDWQARRLAIVSTKGHGSFDLQEASQDFISAIFQLALFPPAQGPAEVWVASGRYYLNRYIEVVGSEELTTRLGTFRALRVRLGREGDDQFDLWYASDLRYLPIRIRWIQKDGSINDLVAVRINYDTDKGKIHLSPPPRAPDPSG